MVGSAMIVTTITIGSVRRIGEVGEGCRERGVAQPKIVAKMPFPADTAVVNKRQD